MHAFTKTYQSAVEMTGTKNEEGPAVTHGALCIQGPGKVGEAASGSRSLSLSLHHSLTALLIWIPNTEREGLSLKFPFHLKFASTKKEHSGTQSSYREKEWFSYITEDTESRLPHPVPKGTLSLAIHCSPGSPSPLKTITLIPEVPQASLLFSLWRGCAHLSYLAFPLVLHVVLFWCTYAHVHEFMCVSPSICLPSLRIYLG